MSGVVIGVGAAIGAVVGGGSSIYGISKQNRSAVAAFKKQMKYLQLNYNYNQASLDRQERSMYDSALGELFSLSLNAFQNNAQIEAAIAETGLEGRSQEKIKQVIHGQTGRQETATKEAYLSDVWNVRTQKDALYIQTKATVEQAKDNLNNNLSYGSKAFQQFLGGAIQGAAIGAATAGIASAAGGAMAGATAAPAVAPTAGAGAASLTGSTSTTVVGTGAINTSLGSGFLSQYGLATNAALSTSAGTAAAGAGTSLATTNAAIAGGSMAGQALTQSASTGASVTPSATGGFMSRMVANYQQYKPYVDFVQQWANYYNTNLPKKQRGGYYY